MNYVDYIQPELLVLAIALYALGGIIKQTETIKDNYIPIILTCASIVFCAVYVIALEGFSIMAIFTAFVQGIIVAATAVWGNQLVKQASKK